MKLFEFYIISNYVLLKYYLHYQIIQCMIFHRMYQLCHFTAGSFEEIVNFSSIPVTGNAHTRKHLMTKIECTSAVFCFEVAKFTHFCILFSTRQVNFNFFPSRMGNYTIFMHCIKCFTVNLNI